MRPFLKEYRYLREEIKKLKSPRSRLRLFLSHFTHSFRKLARPMSVYDNLCDTNASTALSWQPVSQSAYSVRYSECLQISRGKTRTHVSVPTVFWNRRFENRNRFFEVSSMHGRKLKVRKLAGLSLEKGSWVLRICLL